jgi:hypothetical protein
VLYVVLFSHDTFLSETAGVMLFELDDEVLRDDLRIGSKLGRMRLLAKRKQLNAAANIHTAVLDETFTERPVDLRSSCEMATFRSSCEMATWRT